MSEPVSICAVCVTFARVRHLENAIACFLAQGYDGPKRMIVLNTCLKQKLSFTHPDITVVNMPFRPGTIGETRNIANAMAPEGLLVTWDDDDAFKSNHLSNYARLFDPTQHDWVWLDKQLYMEGDKLRGVVQGSATAFGYTKRAWQAVGGFLPMNCGEDRNFQGRVTTKFNGVKVPLSNHEASLIYRWGQGESVYHLSGMGEDKPGEKDGMTRAGEAADIRIGCMAEPQGEIVLAPKPERDWDKLAAQFTGGVAKLTNARRGRIAMVSLGHMGDIINVLPIALHIYRTTGQKPLFISTSQYGGMVLGGCSYLEPLLLDIPDTKILDALAVANQRAEFVLNCQVYGDGLTMERVSKSYNVEQWRVCGLERGFKDLTEFPLVFDQRDENRERRLWEAIMKPVPHPTLLIHVTGGHTSPFKDGEALRRMLTEKWGNHFGVVDLEPVRAAKLYDMMQLLQHGGILVSSDTYLLHLAADLDIPVVAIVNDCDCFGKWMRTEPRYKPVLQLDYSEAMAHVDEIDAAIDASDRKAIARWKKRPPVMPETTPRRFFHAVEIHDDRGQEEAHRKVVARKSWDYLYKEKGLIPCHYTTFERTAQSIGDERPLPFLRDVLKQAMDKANDEDVIVMSNDDVMFQTGLIEAVGLMVNVWGSCTAMRTDFKTETAPDPNMAPEDIAAKGERHLGRDMFAATKSWLVTNWDEIGDFILGAQLWDLAIAALVRSKVGHKLNRKNMHELVTCAELPNGYVYHQHHQPLWAKMPSMNPAHKHNSECFKKWAAVHDPSLVFIGADI
jgi:hypothetical protein